MQAGTCVQVQVPVFPFVSIRTLRVLGELTSVIRRQRSTREPPCDRHSNTCFSVFGRDLHCCFVLVEAKVSAPVWVTNFHFSNGVM